MRALRGPGTVRLLIFAAVDQVEGGGIQLLLRQFREVLLEFDYVLVPFQIPLGFQEERLGAFDQLLRIFGAIQVGYLLGRED